MEVDDAYEEIDGSIHSVHVRNFFCHDNLEISFNRNVNFIVGRNGSGKSAILTALIVGLGGRAAATNRGSNLHSFIKKGANSATIEIKIRNSSPRAYKHDVYGDYITIVRNINASGGSSYKVKSATGEIISTKFEEVNAIILTHDIQVNNPISVLNQDDARSFHASDAKKKYMLFRKATNFDQTETNYVKALENCKKAVAIWNRKNEACQELEKEYKKWKNIHDQMQSRDEIEIQKQALQNEYYWSEIAEFEHETATIQKECEKQRIKCEKLVEKLKNMEENYGSNTSAIDSLKKSLKEKNKEKCALETELRELEDALREAQGAHRNTQRASHKLNELLARENRKVTDLEREIQNIQSGSAASQRAELEAHAQAAEEAAKTARARYETQQNDTSQARANAAHAQPLADRAVGRAQQQRDKLKQLKQQLRELQSRGGDSLAVYGSNMVELCHKLKTCGDFSAPPRGPVGHYLKVKDKKWGGALEHIIGGSLQTFCVNSPEDSRKLFTIMGKVYGKNPKPAVTCSKFLPKVHDVRRNTVRAAGYCSALEALDISDTVVANYLIDNIGLEKILLVPEHEDAIRLSDTVENVPEQCAKVVTVDGTEYHPAPGYRCYGGAARSPRYLHLSTAQRKKQVEAEIAEAEATLRSLEAEAERLNSEAAQARDAERSAAKALQALLVNLHRKEEEAREAASALDQQQAPHYAVLVDELNITKEKVQSLAQQVESQTAEENKCKERVDEIEENIRKIKAQIAKLAVNCRGLSEEIEQEQLKVEQGATERVNLEQRLREGEGKLRSVEQILAEKQALVQQKVQEALMLCARVDNPRDKATVTSELKKTQLKLSSMSSVGLSRAQVAERLLHVERGYRRARLALQRLSALIADIEATSNKHLKFCQQVQTFIAKRVQYCFQSILTLREYSGRIEIDNARGTLQIVCAGRERGGTGGGASSRGSGAGGAASSTSSLSGGERSYSTVAFMMALWDCVELPFYFMDEFDVFMDNVNRRIVMDLLIDHALKNKNRQFVFLTPQDTSAVTASPHITIHVMANPRP
ncbi:structural maintenance of chromosomes protein 6 [Colias croceus]|uniref:structural maintenance of chromosomes protein 6 n=1 Tax=Colias crocea TaxID=72248 RepID=UPI001E27F0EF|nr:structural maintenance of chromosomes protein 6 [Colias croceus]